MESANRLSLAVEWGVVDSIPIAIWTMLEAIRRADNKIPTTFDIFAKDLTG
jgi:hypothetical protein